MTLHNRHILICGASIAGPTLAYWLKRAGFNPTVIERAPQIRAGGYAIDIRDDAMTLIQNMDIWTHLQQEKTTLETMAFVNAHNQPISTVNILAMRRLFDLDRTWAEVMRGDLARAIYERTRTDVEYLFDHSIQAMQQANEGIDVLFSLLLLITGKNEADTNIFVPAR